MRTALTTRVYLFCHTCEHLAQDILAPICVLHTMWYTNKWLLQQGHVQYPVSVTQPQQVVYTNQPVTGQPYPQTQYPQGQVFQGQPYAQAQQPYPQAQAQPVYGGQPAPPPPPAYVAKEPPIAGAHPPPQS